MTLTLIDTLLFQLHTYRHPINIKLAEFIIESLDDNGYLNMSIQEISDLTHFSTSEVTKTILQIQQFEPLEICARNLSECIRIQLMALDCTYERELALSISLNHLDLLSKHDYRNLCKIYKTDKNDILNAEKLIKNCNPKPGSSYAVDSEYIIPDAKIEVEDDAFKIRILTRKIKSITYDINNQYTPYIQRAQTLINNIDKRNQTLYKILSYIINYQKNFFFYNLPLKPLQLKDVANKLEVHESTISRCISSKYIEFNNQIYSLSMFFPSEDNHKVLEKIKHIIQQEDPLNPYSDQQISNILKDEDIICSRRTIQKYRSILNIPTKDQRKHF